MSTTIKCPACGAMVDSFALKCPECGFIFAQESESSRSIRDSIEALQSQLMQEQKPARQAEIINAFTMPATAEGLLNLLVFSYSRFEQSNGRNDEKVSSAWLEKAKQAYKMLKIRSDSDRTIMSKVQEFSFLDNTSTIPKVKASKQSKNRHKILRWVILLGVLAIAVYLFLLILSSMDEPVESDSTVRQQVMELVKEGKYEEARKKAAEMEYAWDQRELMEMIEKEENK
ncbi:MAG: zinc ribbon domain-containing protein [Bacteroidales bacterium]|nr:zinc ribbon domain-containing protein [Bacteroidales bacterium]